MKKSMDVFGQALLDYSKRDKDKFFFEDSKGNRYQHPLRKYFRDFKTFTKLEKKIISKVKGEVLDLGCGTGNYIPYLMKKGKVLGIDISPNVISVAKERYKLRNVKVADIFKFKTNKKFDSIVLLENNLGMAGTLKKTKQLLKILKSLLKKDGQILTNARNVPKGTYYEGELSPVWKERKGQKFKWISFNAKFLKELCEEVGLNFEILERDRYHYLAKITKK
tara:strand:+ start:140 stop:805 length:666 start_codon:yes stop_codon:yes gene_type:complete